MPKAEEEKKKKKEMGVGRKEELPVREEEAQLLKAASDSEKLLAPPLPALPYLLPAASHSVHPLQLLVAPLKVLLAPPLQVLVAARPNDALSGPSATDR